MPTSSDTKDQIISVASALFTKYAYTGVSMSQIAKALGITKAALYYHYPSKLAIYRQVLDITYQDLCHHLSIVQTGKTAIQKLRQLIWAYLNFGLSKSGLIRMMVAESPNNLPYLAKYIFHFRQQTDIIVHSYAKKIINELDGHLSDTLLVNVLNGLLLELSLSAKKPNIQTIANRTTTALLGISLSK